MKSLEYDDLCEHDKKIVDKHRKFLESLPPKELVITRDDGSEHRTIPLKSWRPK